MMRDHDKSLTPEQMARADLLNVAVIKDHKGYYPAKQEPLNVNNFMDCLRHKADNEFRWWADAETALQVASNPDKYEMYWP